jgi:hypothetical protein
MPTSAQLLSVFSIDRFNSLSDYHDIRHLGEADKDLPSMRPIINDFGELFCKHNKVEHALLSLSHRHFKLLDGERNVAWQSDEQNTLHIKAVLEDSLRLKDGEVVLPYLFMPAEVDGQVTLFPLEFVVHSKPDRIAALERDIAAVCDEDFLKDFLKLSRKNKVDGVYGIVLPSRSFLVFDQEHNSTLEGSGKESRSLLVEVVGQDKLGCEKHGSDFTTVAWRFSVSDGKVIPYSACSALRHGTEPRQLCCHCRHCQHCNYWNH